MRIMITQVDIELTLRLGESTREGAFLFQANLPGHVLVYHLRNNRYPQGAAGATLKEGKRE